MSAKISAFLNHELKIANLETFYWVDNKIVLGYITNCKRRFKIFVANRVQIIQDYTKGKNWNYVETKDNPADYASRGISPTNKEKVDMWVNGPLFLREKDESWRNRNIDAEELDDDVEVKVVHAVRVKENMRSVLEILEERVSSWNRMRRVVAWIIRFAAACKELKRKCKENGLDTACDKVDENDIVSLDENNIVPLVVVEIEDAESMILKWVQERSFENDLTVIRAKKNRGLDKKEGSLWRLSPYLDKKGVLRVGGRLTHAEESEGFRFPAVIPKHTTYTKRLIEWHHKKIEHRGRYSTMGELREAGYWVISCGKEVSIVVYACVRCRWLRGKFNVQLMSDLPVDRTTTEPPFTYCGCDFFGAIKVKEGRKIIKRYGVLFTCLSCRGIHIEMASSLDTDTFIQALTRFIGRRGEVRQIRCDNGTNLVGAENELRAAIQEMDHQRIRAYMNENGGDWVLWEKNTPTASHMGGVWERQIRTVKSVLISLIKSSPRVLDQETLHTFLVEAESIVNKRPLTLENISDPECTPLSPHQVLTMKKRGAPPPPGGRGLLPEEMEGISAYG